MMDKTSPPSVAIIVFNDEQALLLNDSGALNENSLAIPYHADASGMRFDAVTVLDIAVTQPERDWFESIILTSAKPDCPIRYASP